MHVPLWRNKFVILTSVMMCMVCCICYYSEHTAAHLILSELNQQEARISLPTPLISTARPMHPLCSPPLPPNPHSHTTSFLRSNIQPVPLFPNELMLFEQKPKKPLMKLNRSKVRINTVPTQISNIEHRKDSYTAPLATRQHTYPKVAAPMLARGHTHQVPSPRPRNMNGNDEVNSVGDGRREGPLHHNQRLQEHKAGGEDSRRGILKHGPNNPTLPAIRGNDRNYSSRTETTHSLKKEGVSPTLPPITVPRPSLVTKRQKPETEGHDSSAAGQPMRTEPARRRKRNNTMEAKGQRAGTTLHHQVLVYYLKVTIVCGYKFLRYLFLRFSSIIMYVQCVVRAIHG